MERVVPWAALVALIAPYYPEGRTGRPPFALETMLCTHFLQQWFSLSDPATEEAFFDTLLYREFAHFDAYGRLPDESMILRFRHRLEKHQLADGMLATVNDLLSRQGLRLKEGMPTAGLVAHTTVSRFVDHIPYYRLEQINARSGVHTPRSTLASWSGQAGAALLQL